MSGHTPGPWIVNPFCAQVDSHAVDEDGDPIPVCQLLWPTDLRSEAETMANAAFIVRACNSHYELLEALEAMVSEYVAGDHIKNLAAVAARAAIAKAKGEDA